MNWNDDTPPDVLTVMRLSIAEQLGVGVEDVEVSVGARGELVASVRGWEGRKVRGLRVQCYIEGVTHEPSPPTG